MINFICGETQISFNDFMQAAFELAYDRGRNNYIKRFNAQLLFDKSSEIYNFLNNNLDNLITITYDSNISMENCKVIFLHSDVINNICRIELQQEEG